MKVYYLKSSKKTNKHADRYANGLAFVELVVTITIIGILVAVAVLNYDKIKQDIKKKACIANMSSIHSATRLFYMENPMSTNENVTVSKLLEQNYLKTDPQCPNAQGLTKSDAFYAIEDSVGKKIDVKCVNMKHSELAHGSFLKITTPVKPGANETNSGSNSN
ncbi:MAG: hypothetical protein QMC67_12810 [Candidatus Wallbacteria bacterium]